MSPSLENHPNKTRKSKSLAWGTLITNLLVLPGLGSLSAGRRVGYPQMGMALTGFSLSVWFLVLAFQKLRQSGGGISMDINHWQIFWQSIQPFLWAGYCGIGLFGLSWFWSLGTSLSIFSHLNGD